MFNPRSRSCPHRCWELPRRPVLLERAKSSWIWSHTWRPRNGTWSMMVHLAGKWSWGSWLRSWWSLAASSRGGRARAMWCHCWSSVDTRAQRPPDFQLEPEALQGVHHRNQEEGQGGGLWSGAHRCASGPAASTAICEHNSCGGSWATGQWDGEHATADLTGQVLGLSLLKERKVAKGKMDWFSEFLGSSECFTSIRAQGPGGHVAHKDDVVGYPRGDGSSSVGRVMYHVRHGSTFWTVICPWNRVHGIMFKVKHDPAVILLSSVVQCCMYSLKNDNAMVVRRWKKVPSSRLLLLLTHAKMPTFNGSCYPYCNVLYLGSCWCPVPWFHVIHIYKYHVIVYFFVSWYVLDLYPIHVPAHEHIMAL